MKSSQLLFAASMIAASTLAAPLFLRAATPTLPASFDQLNHKSIFSRQRTTASPDDPNFNRGNRGPRPQPIYTPVLVGTMVEDAGYFVAFVQDPTTGRMLSFIEGDTLPTSAGVAAGTIKDITLDYIETAQTPGGPTKKITIGQNILGGLAEYPSSNNSDNNNNFSQPTPQPSFNRFGNGNRRGFQNGNGAGPQDASGPGPQDANTAAPADASSPAPAADSSGDDLITRLRKRRQAQLGG